MIKYRFGQLITLMPAVQRNVSGAMSISAGIILPLYTSWKKDPRFDENRNDTYGPSGHIGIRFGVHYRF